MKVRLVLSVGLLALGVGCGSKSSSKSTLSYQFTSPGCDTQLHVFPSKEAMCKGLTDDELNHFCAADLRVEKFLAMSCDVAGVSQNGRMTNVPVHMVGGSSHSSREQYSYSITVNGCATGKQSFNSKAEFCRGLMNDDQNNNCAHDERMELYSRSRCN